jgi:rRNA maturation endonuclease Nob1
LKHPAQKKKAKGIKLKSQTLTQNFDEQRKADSFCQKILSLEKEAEVCPSCGQCH